MKRRSFLGTLSAGAAAALAGGPGSASPGAAKPPEPKVFFYDDGRHASALYQFAPPLSPDDLYLAVDQLVDSGVDTLIYSAGLEGGAVQYDSKVGQKWGDNVPMWAHPIFYRASRNLHQLIADGHDPLKLLCDRCHEKGLRSSGGIRRSACGSSYTMWICPSSSARIATSKSSRSAIDPPMVAPMKMRRGQISESRPQAHATGRGSAHSRPSGPARHSALRGLEGTPQGFTRHSTVVRLCQNGAETRSKNSTRYLLQEKKNSSIVESGHASIAQLLHLLCLFSCEHQRSPDALLFPDTGGRAEPG